MTTPDPSPGSREVITEAELADFLESVSGQRRDRALDLASEALKYARRNREPEAAPPVAAALDADSPLPGMERLVTGADRTCEHRRPNEDPCGAEAPYVVSVGERRHDAQASCERHLGDTVAALAYAEEPPASITVRASAPLLRALTEAAHARDRFREQARILGEGKAEWLCEACNVIHPWRDGDRFTADCPECEWPMAPTSVSVRALRDARARAEAAEAKLAAISDACRSIPTPIADRILAITGSEEEARA